MELSVIIPTLDEAGHLDVTLRAVQQRCPGAEIICVDGGSRDATPSMARAVGAQLVSCARGRGTQLHAGACAARGEVFWFLHADTRPAGDVTCQISMALARPGMVGGNFHLCFEGHSRAARFMTGLYPRLAWLGLRYGDSGIFVRREAYFRAGGFQPLPIFEDLHFLRRLRRQGRLVTVPGPLLTSSRRFQNRPFLPVFLQWTGLQLLYWAGCDPKRLGRIYYPADRTPVVPPTRASP